MDIYERLNSQAHQWAVTIDDVRETEGSLIGFGNRAYTPVVLKISKRPGDEWHSGDVLRAFRGDGIVKVHEADAGAVLLERLQPGKELVELVRCGDDEGATEILATVIRQLSHHEAPSHSPSVRDWARGFDRYLATGDKKIPTAIVNHARDLYLALADSQREVMLLHGDLHHYNVLFDTRRGWTAIDPKGVVGELEYEIGPLLRNPYENPESMVGQIIERRLYTLVNSLHLDYQRVVNWSYAQAILSAIWEIEDNGSLSPNNPALLLADALRPMVR